MGHNAVCVVVGAGRPALPLPAAWYRWREVIIEAEAVKFVSSHRGGGSRTGSRAERRTRRRPDRRGGSSSLVNWRRLEDPCARVIDPPKRQQYCGGLQLPVVEVDGALAGYAVGECESSLCLHLEACDVDGALAELAIFFEKVPVKDGHRERVSGQVRPRKLEAEVLVPDR